MDLVEIATFHGYAAAMVPDYFEERQKFRRSREPITPRATANVAGWEKLARLAASQGVLVEGGDRLVTAA